jgi:hypothetical protein
LHEKPFPPTINEMQINVERDLIRGTFSQTTRLNREGDDVMKKILFAILLILITNLILAGCRENKETKSNSFEIFPVKNSSAHDAAMTDIDKLVLEDEPIITLKDITKYYWQEQILITNKEGLCEQLRKVTKVSGMPFVVLVNGERIYSGTFWTLISSMSPPRMPVSQVAVCEPRTGITSRPGSAQHGAPLGTPSQCFAADLACTIRLSRAPYSNTSHRGRSGPTKPLRTGLPTAFRCSSSPSLSSV